ncbi:hypothetical protein CEXT_414791 [Caerostris extrusa]|uniref:Uncharacterized protein n=1 Tax=Caerostris extrusa TaxID=172846 RepID=A0AAV4RUA2_CAEEX|nr:hypothetical protein CEXT_414791 [Caerostris extrusa]
MIPSSLENSAKHKNGGDKWFPERTGVIYGYLLYVWSVCVEKMQSRFRWNFPCNYFVSSSDMMSRDFWHDKSICWNALLLATGKREYEPSTGGRMERRKDGRVEGQTEGRKYRRKVGRTKDRKEGEGRPSEGRKDGW